MYIESTFSQKSEWLIYEPEMILFDNSIKIRLSIVTNYNRCLEKDQINLRPINWNILHWLLFTSVSSFCDFRIGFISFETYNK